MKYGVDNETKQKEPHSKRMEVSASKGWEVVLEPGGGDKGMGLKKAAKVIGLAVLGGCWLMQLLEITLASFTTDKAITAYYNLYGEWLSELLLLYLTIPLVLYVIVDHVRYMKRDGR